MNRKVLLMIAIAIGSTIVQMILIDVYPPAEYEIVPYVSVAFFGIIISIETTLYSKVKKELFT